MSMKPETATELGCSLVLCVLIACLTAGICFYKYLRYEAAKGGFIEVLEE